MLMYINRLSKVSPMAIWYRKYSNAHTFENVGCHRYAGTESMLIYTNTISTVSLTGTGWRKCTGCLKLQFNVRNRATTHRALLRKMTYQDKASMGLRHPVFCTASRVTSWLLRIWCGGTGGMLTQQRGRNRVLHIYVYTWEHILSSQLDTHRQYKRQVVSRGAYSQAVLYREFLPVAILQKDISISLCIYVYMYDSLSLVFSIYISLYLSTIYIYVAQIQQRRGDGTRAGDTHILSLSHIYVYTNMRLSLSFSLSIHTSIYTLYTRLYIHTRHSGTVEMEGALATCAPFNEQAIYHVAACPWHQLRWCSVFQCVAVCCSVLRCVAVCCSVLRCVAVCCSVLQSSCAPFNAHTTYSVAACSWHHLRRCSVLQRAAASCSGL